MEAGRRAIMLAEFAQNVESEFDKCMQAFLNVNAEHTPEALQNYKQGLKDCYEVSFKKALKVMREEFEKVERMAALFEKAL